MKDLYGVDAGMSSLTYALAATLGIFAYAPSGMLGRRIGDGPVLVIGVLMTLVSMLGMTLLAYVSTGDNWWMSQAAFVFMPVAWSPLIVAGTAYTAELATMPRGQRPGRVQQRHRRGLGAWRPGRRLAGRRLWLRRGDDPGPAR